MGRPRKTPIAQQPALAVHNKYDAAGTGRRMKGWMPPSTGPNRATVGLQKIRDRSRDAVRNEWSGESASQKWISSLIGTGITQRLKRIADKERKQAINDLWQRWVTVADADGVLDFYAMQALVVRAWLDSGEVFVRKRWRRLDSPMEVPMQVQLIEAEFVPVFDADAWPGMPIGNKIRQGIELDRRGQRVAYWMHREHPGEHGLGGQLNLLRVSASEVKHVYELKRPGQLRGVSALAPVLARLRSINDYEDAVLERQKLANLFTAFITRGVGGDADVDPLTNLPMEFGSDGAPLAGLQPGLIQELDYGQDVKFANPPEPGTTYSDYMRTQHMGTSAASGLPYEIYSGDIKEVSDRTLRVIINEFRRFAEQRQWHTVIPMFCQPVREWWTDAAALAGHVTLEERNAVAMVEWAPQGWTYIHPVQDPQGKKIEVEAGFRSRASVIAAAGYDPEEVDEERRLDVEREKELGLWIDPNPPASVPQAQAAAQMAATKQHNEAGQAERPNTSIDQQFKALAMQMQAIQAALVGQQQPQQQPLTVNNYMPAPLVENRVEPTPVSVAAPVVNNTVLVPEINIPATVVNNTVQVPEIHVPPVRMTLEVPPRKTETTIERDQYGNLVKATQTETDA